MSNMNMKRKPGLICIALACMLTLTTAGAADKWLHVKVEEKGARGDNIDVNIPLSVVESMLPLIQVDELRNGKLHLEMEEFGEIDLRELAAALRETPDTDFVTVNSDDESVRVAKEGDFLVVRVEEHKKHSSDQIRIRIPLAVVDALIGDSPNELDLIAGLRALTEYEGEALVDIRSDDSSVQVWIDSSPTGQ